MTIGNEAIIRLAIAGNQPTRIINRDPEHYKKYDKENKEDKQ